MIAGFLNLQSFNDGTTKTVSVFAQADAAGGMETINFVIVGENHSVQVSFASNQGQVVTMAHTAAGQGLVIVTALNSPQSSKRFLNVDKQPGDAGTAVP
jgi:hypothetical protein